MIERQEEQAVQIDLRNINKEYFKSVQEDTYVCIRDHIALMQIDIKVVVEIRLANGTVTKLNTSQFNFKNGDVISVWIDDEAEAFIVPNYLKESSDNHKDAVYNIVQSMNVRNTNSEIHKLFIYNKEHIIDEEKFALSKNKDFYPEFLTYHDRRDAIKLAKLRLDIINMAIAIDSELRYKALIATKYPITCLPTLTRKQKMIGAGMTQYRKGLSSNEFNNMLSVILYPWKSEAEIQLLKMIQEFCMEMGKRGLIL